MTDKTFEEICAHRHDHRTHLRSKKGLEYSRRGDRLWNFKRVAAELGNTPPEACLGLMAKHTVSIKDIVGRMVEEIVRPSQDLIDEKFSDLHNYLDLLEGTVHEYIAEHYI